MPPRAGRTAGPSARSVLASVRAGIAKGWPAGLTVLTGDDVYHLDAAQKLLLGHLVPQDSSDFALSIVGESRIAVPDVVAAARSRPMFALRRVVLVRDVAMLDGEGASLEAYAGAPPEASYLIVRAPKLDLRRLLHQAIARSGRLLEFRLPAQSDPREAAGEIAEIAAEHGIVLGPEVATFLNAAAGGDLHRVAREIEKLDAWAGEGQGRRTVTLEDARSVCASGGLMDGWEAADALLARDPGKAIEAVRRLVEAGREPILLLGGLAWRARTLLQAKAMRESGASPEAITTTLRAWSHAKGLHDALTKYSIDELLAFPARLRAADLALKSRGLDPRAVLESLVLDLTGRQAPPAREAGP